MSYKRILTIQDISCIGQCSLTVALPILSACGLETAVLPSAILSTHTGGFTGFTFRDLTEDIPGICSHWKKEGMYFDAIYSGYLGSIRQIDLVRTILKTMGKDTGCIKITDPAMADNGRLYTGFDSDYVTVMRSLCADADYILPNLTEAALLTGTPYQDTWNENEMDQLLSRLSGLGDASIVLTGVSYEPDKTGVLLYQNGKKHYYSHPKIAGSCHGTGDIFASSFSGALLSGKSPEQAIQIAADFTLSCIRNTIGDETHRYGVKFEPMLGGLIHALESR